MKSIPLQSIIDYLVMATDESQGFIKIKTRALVFVQNEYWEKADDFIIANKKPNVNDFYDWEIKEIKLAMKIQNDINELDYIYLPEKYFIVDDYQIMRDFCITVKNNDKQIKLISSINGHKAFRMFKNTIARFNLEKNWYSFKDSVYKKNAIEWCENNDITYT